MPTAVRCVNCQNSCELPEAGVDLVCPACGSSFRLADLATTSDAAPLLLQALGRFVVQRQLGAGAFGSVYSAVDSDLHRTVAIKIPRPEVVDGSAEAVSRFLREARSAAQLNHPNIVAVHEVGLYENKPFLVSEYVEGLTLADFLTGRRPSFREAAAWTETLARALEYAHQRGVVHRDVKPSNIMINQEGVPLLMDFGLSKRDAGEVTMTVSGQILGTPAYMSPEQARGLGHDVDGRADQYSLGVVFYEMLTGELPFHGNTRMLLHQVLTEEPRPPRKINDRIPVDLETICLKAMAKEPNRRFESCGAFAADLKRWLDGEPIRARPVGKMERLQSWIRRHPAVFSLASGLAALLIVGAGASALVAWRFHHLAEEQRQLRETADALSIKERELRSAAETANKSLLRHRYVQLLALADRELQAGDRVAADRLLDQCPSEFRHWEWNLQKNRATDYPMVLYQKPNCDFECLAWHPNKRWIAACGSQKVNESHQGRLWLLDAATGNELGSYLDPRTHIFHELAISPNGRSLACVGENGIALLLYLGADGKTGLHRELDGHADWVGSVSYSPDGETLATACADGVLRLWDAQNGREIDKARQASCIRRVRFLPNSKQLVTGSFGQETVLWNLFPLAPAHKWPLGSEVLGAAASADGRFIAAAGGVGVRSEVHLLRPQDRTRHFVRRGHTDLIEQIGFSPDSRCLVTVSGHSGVDRLGEVMVWDVEEGQSTARLRDHIEPPRSFAFHPDAHYLATAGMDGRILLWKTMVDSSRIDLPRWFAELDYGFGGTVPVHWRVEDVHVAATPGEPTHFWNVHDGNVVIFVTKADAPANLAAAHESMVAWWQNRPGMRIQESGLIKVGAREASSFKVVGNGAGTSIGDDKGRRATTFRQVTFLRNRQLLHFALCAPSESFPKINEEFGAMLFNVVFKR